MEISPHATLFAHKGILIQAPLDEIMMISTLHVQTQTPKDQVLKSLSIIGEIYLASSFQADQ